MNNIQHYRTQVGIYDQGSTWEAGQPKPVAVHMDVDVETFSGGSARTIIRLYDGDDKKPMGAVLIGEADMKRLALQILMGLF